MKKLMLLLVVACCFCTVQAKQKLVDKSRKNPPEWVLGGVEGSLRVTVDAKDLGEAEKIAMNEVFVRIINSVASNVVTDQKTELSNVDTGDNLESRELYSFESRVRSANLPFLKGVSPTKISDMYWEKLRDDKTGEETYTYSILYPFSRQELAQLIREYEAYDGEKTATLDTLEAELPSVTTSKQIKDAITSLKVLEAYFIDNVRLERTNQIKKRYRELYDQITLNITETGANAIHVEPMLNGKPFAISELPKVKSECARDFNIKAANGGFDIQYNTDDCVEFEDNYIDVTFRIEGKKVAKRYLIKK